MHGDTHHKGDTHLKHGSHAEAHHKHGSHEPHHKKLEGSSSAPRLGSRAAGHDIHAHAECKRQRADEVRRSLLSQAGRRCLRTPIDKHETEEKSLSKCNRELSPRLPSRPASQQSEKASPSNHSSHSSPLLPLSTALLKNMKKLDLASDSSPRHGLAKGAELGTEDSDSTRASTTSCSSPQATSLLLKAMQRRRRNAFEEEVGDEATPRTPVVLSGGRRTPSVERSARAASPGAEFRPPTDRSDGRYGVKPPGSQGSPFRMKSSPELPSFFPAGVSPASSSSAALERQESGLLARRRRKNPDLGSHPALCIDKHEATGKGKETVRIRQLDPDEKIFDLYYWDEVIQEEGCGGKVVVCSPKVAGDSSPACPGSPMSPGSGGAWRKEDGTFPKGPTGHQKTGHVNGTHVMKIKSKAELTKVRAEEQFRKAHLKMLNLPSHTGILPLYEVLEDVLFYYVVMERANGGSLLCSLVEEHSDGIMPENAVKKLMKEILSAVGHVHTQGMLHRDIKVDNLVVQVHNEPATPHSPGGKIRTVQLIDFDIADPDWEPDSPGKKHSGWVGTVRNSAPETFRGIFSQRSDLYSVGTVLYLLMTGRQPYLDDIFDQYAISNDMDDLDEELRVAKISWDHACWEKHQACRDFCMSLLAYEPDQRPESAQDAAQHRWFTGRETG